MLMFLRSEGSVVTMLSLCYRDANKAAYLILVVTHIQNCPSMTPPAGKPQVFRPKLSKR